MTDTVVIAGAGPAGLMLAAELGLAGVPAVVLDRDPTPAADRFSPGTTLHARSIELFERRGLMDAVRAEETVVWPRVHFSNIWVDLTPIIDREYSLILPQAKTERILADRATELGAQIRRGHAVIGLEQDEEGVSVRVAGPDGEYDLRCRFLVGCDGGDSTVRSLVGIQAPPSGPNWYGFVADFEADEDDEWEFDSPDFPNGLFIITPHPEDWNQLRLMCVEFDTDAPADDTPVTREEISASLRRITGTDDGTPPGELRWAQRYTDRTRLASRYREGNVFLAGDAAHLHYYGAGHGLNTSLHDAANLGWKLAAEIHGWAPPALLDSYATERHPVGRRACLASEASLVLGSPLSRMAPLREVFEELMRYENVERHIITMITDVAYPMPPKGLPAEPGSLLGRPVPAAVLEVEGGDSAPGEQGAAEGRISTYEALRSGRGVLFDLSQGAEDVGCVRRWADRVDVVKARPNAEVAATALLVRPDGFVAWVGSGASDGDGDSLATALSEWFGAGS
jgi:2-polyprenyl-6-methoxyphenol hydroxylase-like FAD-dependent oxidoreductase